LSEEGFELIEFVPNGHPDLFITIELEKFDGEWRSDWWFSRKFGTEFLVSVVGQLRVPIFGATEEEARRRIGLLIAGDDVPEFIIWASGGGGGPLLGGNSKIAFRHLAHWLVVGKAEGYNKTETTAGLYALAVEFGLNNPALLVAQADGVRARAVHERVAYARKTGIMESYGRGKVKRGV